MKNIKVIFVFCLIILLVFSLCGCNNTGIDNATVPDATSAETSAVAQEATDTAKEQQNSETYSYTEEDDLEIITIPADYSYDNEYSEDKGEDVPATNAVTEPKPENDSDKQEETKIELPFIPAN